jgi:hypothetical protein
VGSQEFEIDSELPILDGRFRSNPGETAEGSCINHHSPEHLTTMMFLSNDPRYGSHLAGDQGQLCQILIEAVSDRQLVVGRTKVIYHMTRNSLIHGTGMPLVSLLGGPILLNTGSHWNEVRFEHACDQTLFNWTSTLLTWTLFSQTGAQYSAAE